MDELEKGYRFREPAPQTLNFMEEQRKVNQHLELSMNTMQKDIQSIFDKLVEHTKQNNEAFNDLKEGFKGLRNILLWVGGLIVIGFMGALLKLIWIN